MLIAGIGYILLCFTFFQSEKYFASGLYFLTGLYFIVYALTSGREIWLRPFLELSENEIRFRLNGMFKERRIPLKDISGLNIHPVSFTLNFTDGKNEDISLADFKYGDVIEIKNILEQIKESKSI